MNYAKGFPLMAQKATQKWGPAPHRNGVTIASIVTEVFGPGQTPRILEIIRAPLGGYSLIPWEDQPTRTKFDVARLIEESYHRYLNPPKRNRHRKSVDVSEMY